MVLDPKTQKWIFTHLLADRYNLERCRYSQVRGSHKHHLDFNKANNAPENITRLSPQEHLELHRGQAAATLHKKETIEKCNKIKRSASYRRKISDTMKKMKDVLSARAKAQWQNPIYKEYMVRKFLDFCNSHPDYKARTLRILDEAQKNYWSKNENRQKQSRRVTRYFKENPVLKEHLSKKAKEQWQDAGLRTWRKEETAKQWTLEFREKRKISYDRVYLNASLEFARRVYDQSGNVVSYDKERAALPKRNNNIMKLSTLTTRFFRGDEKTLLEAVKNFNHKIKCIENLSERMDVYDIEIPGAHNFALATGVFVHNSAKQGRDRRFQAILPIKGKILNVEKSRLDKILSNEEIRTIITALGTGIGEEFSLERLRYHKIVIMCDADVDGSHIRTLILTLFLRQLPKLIEGGHIYIAQPPLYKVKRGPREEYIQTEDQMNKLMLDIGREGLKFTILGEKKTLNDPQFKELLEHLVQIERFNTILQKKGVDLKKLVENRHKSSKKLPIFIAKVEHITHFLYSDKELARLSEEAKDEKGEFDHVMVYDTDEIEKLIAKIEKMGIAAETYFGLDEPAKTKVKEEGKERKSKPSFRLSNDEDFDFWALRDVLEHVKSQARKGMNIQRYKGLGEMNPHQLWDTTMDPEKRTLLKVVLEDAVEADEIFTILMGDQVEPRRQFIEENAHLVRNLDI
jgi:DNA gyrase subunit B